MGVPGPWALQLSGAVCCSGGVLAVAGAAKIWRGGADSAIRRVLRIRPARWRLLECAAGTVECATAAAVCLGAAPVVAGSVMAALGAVFTVLLVQARRGRAPGGCGCLSWRRAADRITWRAIARAGCVLAAGVADLTAAPIALRQADHAWFALGALTAALVYTLLSVQWPARTLRCRRSLWFPARNALRTVAGNAMFGSFLDSHGPLLSGPRYRRVGCTDQFSFIVPAEADSAVRHRELLFDVVHGAAGAVAVRAAVRDGARPAEGRLMKLPATVRIRSASKVTGHEATT